MNRKKWCKVGHIKDPLTKRFLFLCVDCSLSVKLNISSYWHLSFMFMNESDRSHDLKFLFDKEKSHRSVLSTVFFLEFLTTKARNSYSFVAICFS